MYLQIYMQYPFARKVESVIKKSVFEGRGFGAKMTVEQLIAKQTRIERYSPAILLCNAVNMKHSLVMKGQIVAHAVVLLSNTCQATYNPWTRLVHSEVHAWLSAADKRSHTVRLFPLTDMLPTSFRPMSPRLWPSPSSAAAFCTATRMKKAIPWSMQSMNLLRYCTDMCSRIIQSVRV